MKKILLTVAIFLLIVNLVHLVVYQKQDFSSLSDLLIKLESYPQQNNIDLEYIYVYQVPEMWDETAGAVNWGGGFFDVILDFFQFLGAFLVFLLELFIWIHIALLAPFVWLIANFFHIKDLILYIFNPYALY